MWLVTPYNVSTAVASRDRGFIFIYTYVPVKSWQRIAWHIDEYFCQCIWSCASQQMQRICLSYIGINSDVIGVKASSYWYCPIKIRVAASQICQDILYQDYMLQTHSYKNLRAAVDKCLQALILNNRAMYEGPDGGFPIPVPS